MFGKATILLAAPAFAAALPLFPSAGKTVVKSDLEVFANAWVGTSTGGVFNTCNAVTGALGLNLNLGVTLNTATSLVLSKWGYAQCNTHYNDKTLCGDISAYLAATIYAYQRGWTAIEFFAALGLDRVNHWHDTIGDVCGLSSCPTNTCGPIWGNWDGWYNSYTAIGADASVSASLQALELKSKGFLALIDTAIAATVKAQAHVDVNAHAGAGAIVHRGLPDLLAVVDTKATGHVVSDIDVLHTGPIKVVADASANVLGTAKLGLRGDGLLNGFATGEGIAKVGNVVAAQGQGFALIDKEGILSAGHGDAHLGPVKIAGQGSAAVY